MSNDPFHEQVWPLRNRLYRIALRLVGEPETAEDVVQDTLLKLWQQRDRLAGIGSIEGWCVRLVRNTGIDRTRDAYHRRRTDLDRAGDRADPLPDPAGLLEISDERDRLDRLLAALPPDRRLVIQLREIEGYHLPGNSRPPANEPQPSKKRTPPRPEKPARSGGTTNGT